MQLAAGRGSAVKAGVWCAAVLLLWLCTHALVFISPPHPPTHPPPAGDTPRGMVESAFEFADICREQDYHNFLFSMKVGGVWGLQGGAVGGWLGGCWWVRQGAGGWLGGGVGVEAPLHGPVGCCCMRSSEAEPTYLSIAPLLPAHPLSRHFPLSPALPQASNPLIMVQAYRLLSEEMYARQWDYPLHLGVTEAGEGEDGRMKSAIGIGALLMDGLGDTIRVSLTEDPEFEIDPCGRLAALGKRAEGEGWGVPAFEEHRDTHTFSRRCGWVGSVGKSAWVECGLGSCIPASHTSMQPAILLSASHAFVPPALLPASPRPAPAGWAPCPSSVRATRLTTAPCCTATAACSAWSTPRTSSRRSEWPRRQPQHSTAQHSRCCPVVV